MRTIIAGSRSITELKHVQDAIREANLTITEVVSGGARGVDSLGEVWARMNGRPIKQFIPKWNEYEDPWKVKAPLDRNTDMAEYAEALILVWDGKSKGSQDMFKKASRKGLKIYVHDISKL